jgi:hypothetical protein
MSKQTNSNRFETSINDQNGYWLCMDSLHNVNHDMFFSPFSRYTCQAGCKICYISKQLDDSAKVIHQYAPKKITTQQEEIWKFWFDKFHQIGYSDDIVFTRENFPHVYAWIKKNAKLFRYTMTDNAILRQHSELMNELDFNGIMDISISDSFLDLNPLLWENIKKKLEQLKSKYSIDQIKFLITKPGPYSRQIGKLIDWVSREKLSYLIHHNFTDEHNLKHEVDNANNVNDWVMCQNGRLFEIQKETLLLFNDRWFFSSQDATSRNAFWIMTADDFNNVEKLLTKMIEGKQVNYTAMGVELAPSSDLAKKFKSYFQIPSTYKINYNYNFIPKMLISPNAKLVNFLQSQGWLNTEHGLYKPNETVTSIIEPISQEK